MLAAQVLVLETCGGLVTGAAAERLGGFGTVCCAYTGRSPPSQDAVRMFNFPWAMRESLCCASLERLSAAAASDCTSSQPAGEAAAASQLANGTAALASAPVASVAIGQAEAAVPTVPMAVDVIGPPDSSGSGRQADPTEADVGARRTAMVTDGLTDGIQAAHNGLRPGASTTATQTAEQTAIGSESCAAARAADEMPGVPSDHGAAPEQRSEADGSLSERTGNGVPAAGRLPRNMEPKRCITAVPPARLDQLRALVLPGFDSCLIAAPALQPLAAIQRLLPFLAPSAFFVVFSPVLQPLAEAMAGLQASKAATNLQLQVLRALLPMSKPSVVHAIGLCRKSAGGSAGLGCAGAVYRIAPETLLPIAVHQSLTYVACTTCAGKLVAGAPGAAIPDAP